MPAAPDFPTLYDFSTAIETAFQELLASLSVPAFIQRQQSTIDPETGAQVDLPEERVDIQLTMGSWTGRWGVTNQPNTLWGQPLLAHSAWNYTLRFNCLSNRICTDPGRIAAMAAQIRLLIGILLGGQITDSAILPYHALVSINEQTDTPQVSVEDDQDICRLVFTGELVIRSDAWPLYPPVV